MGQGVIKKPVIPPAGLQNIKSGYFARDVSLASGDQIISGIGFLPKFVLIFASIGSVAGACSWGLHESSGGGFTDYFNSIANAYNPIAAAVKIYTADPDYYTGVISSFNADGFTITWTKTGAPTGTMEAYFVAIG